MIPIINKYTDVASTQRETILIYEHGFLEPNNSSIPLSKDLNDQYRIILHRHVLQYVIAIIRNGLSNCRCFIWTQLDEFQVLSVYTWHFSFHYMDLNENLKQYPKLSTQWYKIF